jgi:cobaltochelatase CobN
MDKYKLDMQRWFEQHNPTAQAQIIERMLEAIRKGYWDASEQTRREIVKRWQQLDQRSLTTGAEATRQFAQQMASGFGLRPGNAPAEATSQSPNEPSPAAAQTQTVRGQVMQETPSQEQPEPLWRIWLALLAILLCFIGGGLQQLRHSFTALNPGTT